MTEAMDALRSIADIPKLPPKWEMSQLKDIATLITKGTTPTTYHRPYVDDGVPFLRAEDVEGGEVQLSSASRKIDFETHELLRRSKLQAGDVLVTIAGAIGRSALVPDTVDAANINQAVALVRVRKDVALPEFISRQIESNFVQSQLGTMQRGVAQKNLNLEQIGDLYVTLPPIETQRTIVSTLQRANRLRDLREQANQLTNKIIQSVFLKMFGDPNNNGSLGYPTTPLDDLVENLDSKRVPLNEEQRSKRRGDVPYYGASGLVDRIDDSLFDEPLLLVAEDGENLRSRNLPIAYSIFGKSWVNNHAHVLRCVKINQRFVEFWFNLLDISPYLGGSTRPKLNKTILMVMEVPVPPQNLQIKFAETVNKIEAMRCRQLQSTQEINQLFHSLMQKAFTGQLVA
jgi:type I restriction enzyme S subunit